ncbi:glycine zipper 2TM domain-containing protein [Rhodoferax ferrireducens]|uniref:glycine zipper 2TM domain-containing protein n=1 Tax=Rhodoferax ferrireducens TaxID=192843 RepID=UPI003BB5B6E9
MKKLLLWSAAMVGSGLSLAQEVGHVISATPVMQQVGIPRQVCSTEQVAVQPAKSGAGAVMGAIAGGAMGNAVGGGGGKAAATMLGIFGGAVLGDRIEGAPAAEFQNVQRCAMQTFFENRPVAYNVVYEFGGKQYSVQMPNDPGPTIELQITPVGAGTQWQEPATTTSYVQPSYGPPANVVLMPPAYTGYYARPYYPPVGIEFDFGYRGGHGGRRHWR